MKKVEENKWLGDNQTGGRKNVSTIETETLNELIIKNHRPTRRSLYIHQDDTMGYYDRIIRTHAILNSGKYCIPDKICILLFIAHENMTFRTQINNNTSKIIYKSMEELTMSGVGQGIGNG